jgi:hypothetical protein
MAYSEEFTVQNTVTCGKLDRSEEQSALTLSPGIAEKKQIPSADGRCRQILFLNTETSSMRSLHTSTIQITNV